MEAVAASDRDAGHCASTGPPVMQGAAGAAGEAKEDKPKRKDKAANSKDLEAWKIVAKELAGAFTRIHEQLEDLGGERGGKRKRDKGDATGDKRKKREPTAYNMFVKAHTPEVRDANPGLGQNAVFAKVAELWKVAPENPKRILEEEKAKEGQGEVIKAEKK